MTFELLAIVPREEPDDEDEVLLDLKRILVVCCRNSIIIVSSGDAGRASGQMKLCVEKFKNLWFQLNWDFPWDYHDSKNFQPGKRNYVD